MFSRILHDNDFIGSFFPPGILGQVQVEILMTLLGWAMSRNGHRFDEAEEVRNGSVASWLQSRPKAQTDAENLTPIRNLSANSILVLSCFAFLSCTAM